MRVFVTGSTGFVGTSVVEELITHGHTVLGLTRNAKGAAQLAGQGAESLIGTIEQLDLLRAAAAGCDAAIHLAFVHDFANFADCCAKDRAAITALGETLAAATKANGGSGSQPRALVTTSGTMMLTQGKLGDEDAAADVSNYLAMMRSPSEGVTVSFAAQGVRASVVRLPPTTHGNGWSGFMGMLAQHALSKGAVGYVGDGQNVWSAGHAADAAVLYRLAMEKAAPGSIFHAVAEQGVPVKDIATKVGEELGLPVVSVPADKAEEHFEWFAFAIMGNNPVSSKKTRERLGWTPTAGGVLESVKPTVAAVKAKVAADSQSAN